MNYYISANIETECGDKFPSGLSFFFEQIGGYGDESMVSQVEKILEVDLSNFQEFTKMDDEDSDIVTWQSIEVFEQVINSLLTKIEDNPEYYKSVIYHPNPILPIDGYFTTPAEFEEVVKRRQKSQEEYEKHPMYGYPNDDGYLSSGEFVNDLKVLKSILECYVNAGATMIKLDYV